MESRMKFSRKVYLMVEHLDGEDFDYWVFETLGDALEWLSDYPTTNYNWALSSEPVGLPESEYTLVKE
jgi:hypothetical protein